MQVVERLLENTLTLARANLIATTFNIYAESNNFVYDVEQLRNSYRVFFVSVPKSFLRPINQLVIDKHTQLFTAPDYYSPYLFDLVYEFDWSNNVFTLSFRYNFVDKNTNSIASRTISYNTFQINPSSNYVFLPVLGHRLLTDPHTILVMQNSLLSQNLLQFVLDRENYYLVDLAADLIVSSTAAITPKVISNPFLTAVPQLIQTRLSSSKQLNPFAVYRNKFVYIGAKYNDLTRAIVGNTLYTVFDMLCDIYRVDNQIINTMYILNKVDMNLFTANSVLSPVFKYAETTPSIVSPSVSYRTIITFLPDTLETDVVVGPVETVILTT